MSHCNGHRWSKFWWRDYQGDAALRACSLAARGYWMELLCIAHEATPTGHVLINGKKPTHRQLAAIAGCTEREAKRLELELEDAGVFSRTPDDTIYCRRMVRDGEASEAGREHIAKRWNGAKTTPPPNRVPTSKPTSSPSREANSDPFTRGRIQKKEAEEERKEKDLPTVFVSPERAQAAPAAPVSSVPEAAIEAEPVPTAQRIATQNIVGKVARKFESAATRPATKYPEHSVAEQVAASQKLPTLMEIDPRVAQDVLAARRAFMERATRQQAQAS